MSKEIIQLNEEINKGELKDWYAAAWRERQRYRRRESSVEEALIEMYLAGEWRILQKLCVNQVISVDYQRVK